MIKKKRFPMLRKRIFLLILLCEILYSFSLTSNCVQYIKFSTTGHFEEIPGNKFLPATYTCLLPSFSQLLEKNSKNGAIKSTWHQKGNPVCQWVVRLKQSVFAELTFGQFRFPCMIRLFFLITSAVYPNIEAVFPYDTAVFVMIRLVCL